VDRIQVYYLGKKFAKQIVNVHFNAEKISWIVKDDKAEIIKEIKAKNFTKQNLLNLSICQRTSNKL